MTKTIIDFLGCVIDGLRFPTCPLCGCRVPGTRRLSYHLIDVHGWLPC